MFGPITTLGARARATCGDDKRRSTRDLRCAPGLLENSFFFNAALGVPAYAYGPGLLSVAHGPHEYVI